MNMGDRLSNGADAKPGGGEKWRVIIGSMIRDHNPTLKKEPTPTPNADGEK